MNFNHKFPLGYFQLQRPDIPIAEILHFLHGSGHSCGFVYLVGKIQRVLTDQVGQMLFKLRKENGSLHIFRSCDAEIYTLTNQWKTEREYEQLKKAFFEKEINLQAEN